MVSHQIVALPGDGIGPEVVAEAIKVLETIQNASSSNITFDIASHDFGGIAIDNHGDPLPESTLSACKASDAIILGQFGGVVRVLKPDDGAILPTPLKRLCTHIVHSAPLQFFTTPSIPPKIHGRKQVLSADQSGASGRSDQNKAFYD